MAYKATFKGSYTDKYDKRYTQLFYEYRGHEYQVTKANSWTGCSSDYIYGDMRLSIQHKKAQETIDWMIEHPRTEERTPEEIAEAEEAQRRLDEAIDMMFSDIE